MVQVCKMEEETYTLDVKIDDGMVSYDLNQHDLVEFIAFAMNNENLIFIKKKVYHEFFIKIVFISK